MVIKKAFDVAMSTEKLSLCSVYNNLNFMSRVKNVCLFVINYLSQSCHELSKARCGNFVSVFLNCQKVELKLHKLVTTALCQDFVDELFLILFREWNYLIIGDMTS